MWVLVGWLHDSAQKHALIMEVVGLFGELCRLRYIDGYGQRPSQGYTSPLCLRHHIDGYIWAGTHSGLHISSLFCDNS